MFALTPASGLAEPPRDGAEPTRREGAARILGHWQRGKGEAIIEVSERGGHYSGVIVWSGKRPETVGIEVFRDMRYDSENQKWQGRAYSIKRKREVPIDVRIFDRDHLELTAYVLIFTKDVDFHRVPSSTLAALRAERDL